MRSVYKARERSRISEQVVKSLLCRVAHSVSFTGKRVLVKPELRVSFSLLPSNLMVSFLPLQKTKVQYCGPERLPAHTLMSHLYEQTMNLCLGATSPNAITCDRVVTHEVIFRRNVSNYTSKLFICYKKFIVTSYLLHSLVHATYWGKQRWDTTGRQKD